MNGSAVHGVNRGFLARIGWRRTSGLELNSMPVGVLKFIVEAISQWFRVSSETFTVYQALDSAK